MTALVALKSLRRTPIVAKNDNVVQFGQQCRARFNELPDHVKEILIAGFDEEDTVTEVPQPKPQQVAPKPVTKTKRQARAELKAAKKAAKRKEDKPEHKAEVTPPKVKPVVKEVAERKAEPTAEYEKNLTPQVLGHYLTRIKQGKMNAARMFLRDCSGMNEAESQADYDLRLSNMNAFVEEHVDVIRAACEEIEPAYDGDAVTPEWSANGNPVTLCRSRRVPNWINKAGQLHRKGWKIQQYTQIIPSGYYDWLNKSNVWTKTNQRPVAVTLVGTGMVPIKLEHARPLHLGGNRIGTQLLTEHIMVPAGDYSLDRIEAMARAYRSNKASSAPVQDLPPPPVVAATVVGDRRNVEVVEDTPPWIEEEESFLTHDLYLERQCALVNASVNEPLVASDNATLQNHLGMREFQDNQLQRLTPKHLVLAGTPVPVTVKTQGETLIETILLDTEEEVTDLAELREAFQMSTFGPDNHFIVSPHTLRAVDKENILLEQRNKDQAWLFHRNPLPGSAYVMYRTNPYLIAEANRWDHSRKMEMVKAVRKERQIARTKSKMSQKKLYDLHWQRLLEETTPLTVNESLVRLNNSTNVHTLYGGLRSIIATPRRIHVKATRLRRKLILSRERQVIVATAKAKVFSAAVIRGECKSNNPYYQTPVTKQEPVTSDTVAAIAVPFIGPPTKESEEQATISMIRASVIQAEAWVAKANAVLNGKVVDLRDARELMTRYKEVPVNLALG
jgi:hypothetical protein